MERSYPKPEEQQRFIKAYVDHRPTFASASTPSATPTLGPQQQPSPHPTGGNPAAASSSSSIVEFMLDARVPPGGWKEEERRAAEARDARVRDLLSETRLWRAMNSAQWVAWGIVQAKIPGYTDNDDDDEVGRAGAPPSPAGSEATVTRGSEDAEGSGARAAGGENEEEEGEGFDYLSYAHERALFFWGDCVQMGLIRLEELPEGLRGRVKMIEY